MLTNIILVHFVSACLIQSFFSLAFVVESLRTRRTNNIPFSAAIRSLVRVRLCVLVSRVSFMRLIQRKDIVCCMSYTPTIECIDFIVFIIVFRFVARERNKKKLSFRYNYARHNSYTHHLAYRLKRMDTTNWNGKQLRHFSSRCSCSKRRPHLCDPRRKEKRTANALCRM